MTAPDGDGAPPSSPTALDFWLGDWHCTWDGGEGARLSMILAIVGVSLPVFWLGQLLLYFLCFKLHLAPSSGLEIDASVWTSAFRASSSCPGSRSRWAMRPSTRGCSGAT